MPDRVYKVVLASYEKGGELELQSSLAGMCGGHHLVYTPGHRTEPSLPGSLIYAFDSLDAAEKYIGKGNSSNVLKSTARLQVWEGIGEIVATQPVCTIYPGQVEKFWTDHLHANEYADTFNCHKGSVWCSWVTVQRMVGGEMPSRGKP